MAQYKNCHKTAFKVEKKWQLFGKISVQDNVNHMKRKINKIIMTKTMTMTLILIMTSIINCFCCIHKQLDIKRLPNLWNKHELWKLYSICLIPLQCHTESHMVHISFGLKLWYTQIFQSRLWICRSQTDRWWTSGVKI